MTGIKFCGLRTPEDVSAALRSGARWAGFVHFENSPRHVAPAEAGPLFTPAVSSMESVSVTVDADDALLAEIQAAFAPDWIQLHGSETPERVAEVRRFARKGVIKAIPVAGKSDLAVAKAFETAADMILFDAKPPRDADRPGGWGEGYDYSLLKTLNISTPWLLSGGLTPDNVQAAVAASGATAVDVSSGIESAPGVKSAEKMAAFAKALRG
jgi:phosphoribosylanthranilate isomerase